MHVTKEEFRVAWVRRLANGAAHLLANHGCANKLCKTWVRYLPDCMRHFLDSGCAEMNE